eukprot:3461830-Prymnesium_polylepis.1
MPREPRSYRRWHAGPSFICLPQALLPAQACQVKKPSQPPGGDSYSAAVNTAVGTRWPDADRE